MELAEMICGASGNTGGFKREKFEYRTSSGLTRFFLCCDIERIHQSGTRHPWVEEVLLKLNSGPAASPQFPADGIVRVIQELMEPEGFKKAGLDQAAALTELNETLTREGLEGFLDEHGKCHLRAGEATSTGLGIEQRHFSQKDLQRRADWVKYLDEASEDDFTTNAFFPLLQQLGFIKITVAGHKDKALEFGKDMWMKLKLPTLQFLYFAVQVKLGKIDSAGKSKGSNENVTEILNQVRMALQNPIWDPDINRKVLIDHVYLVCTGEITKQARLFLGEHLDQDSRRQVMFLERDDILNLLVLTNTPVPSNVVNNDEFQF